MRIRKTLRRKNHDLKQDLEALVRLVGSARVVGELEPYRAALLMRIEELLAISGHNLACLETGEDSLLPDLLSETSTLLQHVRLIKVRHLRGLYRAADHDRVCLQTISWLHGRHERTRAYPAVFADDDVSIIPSRRLPFYFFPCLEQQGLRFQPLFFHEFGHLLYQCHEQELNALVEEFQQTVEAELLPASQRNDRYAQEQAWQRQSIVETWYKWVQEFYCDAVGLAIGGPSFLNALAEYIGSFRPADYYRQASDLHGSSHPLSWLRIKLLAERAARAGYGSDADRVLEIWNDTASLLRVGEDHHGFYTASLTPSLVQTVDDMVVEAAPYQCNEDEVAGIGWDARPLNLVAVLNKVWLQYFEDPGDFQNWETVVLERMYGLRLRSP
jgi:hypothetical protein